jgi:hypothetical protein
MIPTGPDAIVIYFYAGFLALTPILIVLHTWDSRARPLGQSLIKTAERCIWYFLAYLFGIGLVLALLFLAVSWRYGDPLAGYSQTMRYAAYLVGSSLVWLGSCWYGAQHAYLLSPPHPGEDEHKRGAVIEHGRDLQLRSEQFRARCARNKTWSPTVRLAGVEMPRTAELMHTLILGSTGSGKSNVFHGLLADIARRARQSGERMILLDPDGNYMERHYDPARGDQFWNPFVEGSLAWNPILDLREPYDAENIAANLVPEHRGGADSHWTEAAKIVIAAALKKLRNNPQADARMLYEICVLAPLDTQREFFADTAARRYFDDGAASETIASYLGNLTNALTPLQYLLPRGEFAFGDWVLHGRGWLFLPYTAGQIAAIRPLYRIAMRSAIFAGLDLPKPPDAAERWFRIWYALDEFDALGRIDGLVDAMIRLRGHGCPVVLGAQTAALFLALYGPGFEAAIKENAKNKVVMHLGGGDQHSSAEFASRLIGTRQVRRITHSASTTTSHGTARGGETANRAAGASTNEQVPIEPAVLPSEIEQLRTGDAYLRFATWPEWLRLRAPLIELPTRDNPFARWADKREQRLRSLPADAGEK